MIWANLSLLPAVISCVLIGCCALIVYAVRYSYALRSLSADAHRSFMLPGFSWLRFAMRLALLTSALGAISVALLRPQREGQSPTVQYEYGRDVVIAVDISRSMLAQDCAPNRLACARAKIMELVRMLRSERLGLVVFSGSALVQCPLTKDVGAFQLFLNALDPQILSTGGTTALDQAILAGIRLFSDSQRKHKLMILITDGEDFSTNLTHAATEAERIGLHIAILGIGTPEGAPVPLLNADGNVTGHQRDEHNQIVISRLNEPLLRSLADRSGNVYTRLTPGSSTDSERISAWVKKCELERFATTPHPDYEEWHMVGSVGAFFSLLCAWLL